MALSSFLGVLCGNRSHQRSGSLVPRIPCWLERRYACFRLSQPWVIRPHWVKQLRRGRTRARNRAQRSGTRNRLFKNQLRVRARVGFRRSVFLNCLGNYSASRRSRKGAATGSAVHRFRKFSARSCKEFMPRDDSLSKLSRRHSYERRRDQENCPFHMDEQEAGAREWRQPGPKSLTRLYG